MGEPGLCGTQAEGVAPGVHVGHQALASGTGDGVGKENLQIAGGVLFGL